MYIVKYHHDMTSVESRQAAFNKVLELVSLLNADMESSFARDGLTTSRAHLMWVLQESGPSTQRPLADALDVSARNITGLVDALAAQGLVVREPHPADRRATLVSLTDRGSAVAKHMEDGHIELSNVMFEPMSEQEFTGFAARLDDVVERLRLRLAAETYEEPHA